MEMLTRVQEQATSGQASENINGTMTNIRSFEVDLTPRSKPIGRLNWARISESMRKPKYVFDGRNMLDHKGLEDLGFRVEAIGKASRRSDS